MFILDVEARVAEIATAAADDPEAAGDMERALLRDVLESIADGHVRSARLAETALRVFKLDFPRW